MCRNSNKSNPPSDITHCLKRHNTFWKISLLSGKSPLFPVVSGPGGGDPPDTEPPCVSRPFSQAQGSLCCDLAGPGLGDLVLAASLSHLPLPLLWAPISMSPLRVICAPFWVVSSCVPAAVAAHAHTQVPCQTCRSRNSGEPPGAPTSQLSYLFMETPSVP